jgi:hypothetical protein
VRALGTFLGQARNLRSRRIIAAALQMSLAPGTRVEYVYDVTVTAEPSRHNCARVSNVSLCQEQHADVWPSRLAQHHVNMACQSSPS